MHDRRLIKAPAEIDHLLAGPPGVVVADSKDYKGRLKIFEGDQVVIGDSDFASNNAVGVAGNVQDTLTRSPFKRPGGPEALS